MKVRISKLLLASVFATFLVAIQPLSQANADTSVGPNGNSINVEANTTVRLNSLLTNPLTATGFPETLTVQAVLSTDLGTLLETETAANGISAVTGFQALGTAASSIAFAGTPSQINSVLNNVQLIAPTTVGGSAHLTLTVSARGSGSIAYNPTNGHFYQYVSTPVTWDAAFNAITGASLNNDLTVVNVSARTSQTVSSCAYSFNGMCGYFATVSTSSENDFVKSKVGTSAAWLGGSDRRYEGQWKWEDPKAPEYDMQFSTQSSSAPARIDQTTTSHTGTASTSTGQPLSYVVGGSTYSYANWNPNEPNNSGGNENALELLSGTSGLWNDLSETSNLNTRGYIVEYGGNGETLSYPTATRTFTAVINPPAPTFGSITSVAGGFTVQISNFVNTNTYETVTVSAGSATISGTGLITVTGLTSGQSSTVDIRMTSGGQVRTASVTGTSSIVATPCPTTYCSFDNGALHFGNPNQGQTTYTVTQSSINSIGLFNQPYYKSPVDGKWYKLTYSTYPLDMALGTGTSGTNWTTNTVVDLASASMASQVVDYSGFVVTSSGANYSIGYGTIVVQGNFTINGSLIQVTHTYQLGRTDSFVKATTKIKNISGSTVNNLHIWIGTRDDYVGNSDAPVKTRGNLDGAGGAFQALSNQTTAAQALQITTSAEGALFYSTSPGTNMAYNSCCSFSNAYNQNPSTSGIQSPPMDGSYAAVLSGGNIASNASSEIVWYYAAGAIANLAAVSRSVSAAAAAGAPGSPSVTRGNGSAFLDWNDPVLTDSSTITDYVVQYSSDNGATWTTFPHTASPASQITVTGLNNGTSYVFRIAAVTTLSGTSTTGASSTVSSPAIIGTPLADTATVTSSGTSATVSFGAPNSNGSPITAYEYQI